MNKPIFITGASSGIGKTTAKYFPPEGLELVATMPPPKKEEELTQLANVLATRLDAQDSTSITAAVAEELPRSATSMSC